MLITIIGIICIFILLGFVLTLIFVLWRMFTYLTGKLNEFKIDTMNLLQIKNGKIEIRKDNGALIRTIGNGDAVTAEFNNEQTLVAITTTKGKVEIRKENGALVRTIGNGDATNTRWNGSDLAITTSKGKTEIRKENGSLIRTL